MFMRMKKRGALSRLGFAAAVCVCMLCIGAATWLGLERLDSNLPIESDAPRPTSSAVSSVPKQLEVSSSTEVENTDEPPVDTPADTDQTVQTTAPVAGYFVMPLTGEIIKDYDAEKLQYSMTYKDWRLHTAVDIAGEKGCEIKAAGDGKVSRIYADSALGTVVEIDHGAGITARYASIDSAQVAEGDVVSAGAVIGYLGITLCEGVEQVHLHFEMYKDGGSISPTDMFGVN